MMQGVSEPSAIVPVMAFFGSRDAPVSASYIAEQRTGDRTLKMTHAGSLPLIVPPAAWENNQVRADPLDAVERLLGRCDAGYFFQMGERVPARLGRTREAHVGVTISSRFGEPGHFDALRSPGSTNQTTRSSRYIARHIQDTGRRRHRPRRSISIRGEISRAVRMILGEVTQ